MHLPSAACHSPCFPLVLPLPPVQVDRLKQCYEGIFSRSLRRALVDDCCAHAVRRHADVSKRNIEAYLAQVVHRLVARR